MRRRVGSHHARTAPIGQDRQLVGLIGAKARQRLGRQEQLLHRVNAQHAGPGNGCVIHQVRARQRAGMRRRGPLALPRAPGLDHDHRLVARRRARRRHEFARRLDGLDVHQDRTCPGVAGQVVEQVAEVHIGMLSQRHDA